MLAESSLGDHQRHERILCAPMGRAALSPTRILNERASISISRWWLWRGDSKSHRDDPSPVNEVAKFPFLFEMSGLATSLRGCLHHVVTSHRGCCRSSFKLNDP